MTTETDRAIAKREPQKGVNGSNGTQAVRFAVHELPIPGAADSLRKSLRIASHRLPITPFPGHPERCGDVEPDSKQGNCYNASRGIQWVLKQAVRGAPRRSPAASRISPCRPPGRQQSSPASSRDETRFSSHHYGWIDRCRALTLAAGRNAAPSRHYIR